MSPSDAPQLEEVIRRAKLSVSAVRLSELEMRRRMDAEFYQPHYLEMVKRLSVHAPLASYKPTILHPVEVKRVYEADGIGIQSLLGQNIRSNWLDFSFQVFFPSSVEPTIRKNKLRVGDVVMTRSGVNYGDSACYDGKPVSLYASADCLVVRAPGVPGSYLATFFNTHIGSSLIKRGGYGAAQPHIAPDYVRTLHIPRDSTIESVVEQKLRKANEKFDESVALFSQAQVLLITALGLDKLDLSEGFYSVRGVSEIVASSRADAEYYKTKYLNLLSYIDGMPNAKLSEIATFSGGATPLGADYLDEGIPLLRIQNVNENRLDMSDVVYIDQSIHEGLLNRSRLAPRDVLITITGRIGTCAVVPDDVLQSNINQHVVRMRLKNNDFNPYYLAAFLNSVGGKLQTERESYGTTRDALPYYCLARIRVLKADDDLQQEIEKTVMKADKSRRAAMNLLVEAKAEVERMIESS